MANERKDRLDDGHTNIADAPATRDDGQLTPPHGDDLRDELTFGRTDRYANVDDANASRQQPLDESDDREMDNARRDVRRREHSAD